MSSTVSQVADEGNAIRAPIFGVKPPTIAGNPDITQLENFLRRVLPREKPGRCYCMAFGRLKPVKTKFFATIAELAWAIIRQNQSSNQVWYCPAAFDAELVAKDQEAGGSGRKNAHVVALNAIRQDIDIDPSGAKGKVPCHNSVEEARAAHAPILADMGLPPALYINSGGGLHAYVAVNREMTPAEFVAASTMIRVRIEKADPRLAIDTSRWADPCGLLRPTCTSNLKYEAPRAVEILS